MPQKQIYKRISEVIPLSGGGFHSDAPQIQISDILDRDIIIADFEIREGHGEWGDSKYALIYGRFAEPPLGEFTILCGGAYVVAALEALTEDRLPVIAKISKPGRYYTIQ